MDDVGEPFAGCHEDHSGNIGEYFFFNNIILPAVVFKKRVRIIRTENRTIITARCPFLALRIIKIGALPGYGPAVVERPYNGDAVRFDIGKKYAHVNIKSVQIMQMQDIRLYLVQPAQKSFCGGNGTKAAFPLEKIAQDMASEIQRISDLKSLNL